MQSRSNIKVHACSYSCECTASSADPDDHLLHPAQVVPDGYDGNYHYHNLAHGGGHLYAAVSSPRRQLNAGAIAAQLTVVMNALHDRQANATTSDKSAGNAQ